MEETEDKKINKNCDLFSVLLTGFAAIIVIHLSSFIFGPSKEACTKAVCLPHLLKGGPSFDDERLRKYLRSRFFDRASGPPKYKEKVGFDNNLETVSNYILDYFNGKKNGYFVVLGAGDGEYQDLTIPLEKDFGWSGFLVEPHPELFKRLKGKGRNALLSKNCISIISCVEHLRHSKITVEDSEEDKLNKWRDAKLSDIFENDTDIVDIPVQCVNFGRLLYAAGYKKPINLLVLDMAGTDLATLRGFNQYDLPEIELIVIRDHGIDIQDYVSDYFLKINHVGRNIFGINGGTVESIYVFHQIKKLDI